MIEFMKKNKEIIVMKYIRDLEFLARAGLTDYVKKILPFYYEYYRPGNIYVSANPEITERAAENARKNGHREIYDMIVRYGRSAKL